MANIKLKHVFICENVIVSISGQPSLINLNISSEIVSTAFPAIHPKMTLLVITTGDSGSYNEKIEIVSADDNKTIVKTQGKIEIKEGGINNFIADFINTIFPKEGKYYIKISINEEIISNENEHFIKLKKV
jgi:hypothetical protein